MRLSVRGLMVLTLVIGGWLGWIVRSTRVQREAVAAINGAGGSVLYDWQWVHGRFIPTGRPGAPGWLVDRMGNDYWGHVVYANVNERGSDTTLSYIAQLSRLEELELAMAPVTDSRLAHINGLSNLRVLSLNSAGVSNAGLIHLEGLRSLERLVLASKHVTDAGLAHLRGLHSLSILSLAGAGVTDAGLMHLRELRALEMVDLTGTAVTDAGVVALRQALPKLSVIH
jgi:hypothetical protein